MYTYARSSDSVTTREFQIDEKVGFSSEGFPIPYGVMSDPGGRRGPYLDCVSTVTVTCMNDLQFLQVLVLVSVYLS